MATENENIDKKELLLEHLIVANKQFDDAAKELDTKLMAFTTVALGLSGWGITVLDTIELLLIIPFFISIILFVIGIWPKQVSVYPSDKMVIYGCQKHFSLEAYLDELLNVDGVTIDESGYAINPKINEDVIKPNIKRIQIKSGLFQAGLISIAVGMILVFVYKLMG